VLAFPNRASHERSQFRRICPTLGAPRRIDRRTVIPSFRAQHGLNAAKRGASHRDAIRSNEVLLAQTTQGPPTDRLGDPSPATEPWPLRLPRCRRFFSAAAILIANVWTRRGTQTLASPVGSKEHPSMACEYRPSASNACCSACQPRCRGYKQPREMVRVLRACTTIREA